MNSLLDLPVRVSIAFASATVALMVLMTLNLGCNPSGMGSAGQQKTAVPSPTPKVEVPSVAGNWTGTQTGITDVNNAPFQAMAQFLPDGTYTLSANWQGRNGPAGQTMTGHYTQSGTVLNLTVAHEDILAAGQTTAMPSAQLSQLALTGTITPDGKSVHVGQGPAADYLLTRN